MDNLVFNKCQSTLEELEIQKYPAEVQEQFFDFLNNVPFIRWMVSPDRPMISELPRDAMGRAIIDVTKPPILEDSDFFRQTALRWQETGQYNSLRPNANPNSEFGRWLREERRRGWEGYVNPANGMWITGDYYWMLNYCPMHLVVKRNDGLEMRATRHPKFWDGQFFVSHYILQSRMNKHHSAYLASRGKGKAHPYSQIVYTPDGAKKWGDIQVGDSLFGDDGNLTKVTAIPFDDEEKIYTVTLADGRKLKCTSGHLFYVKDNRKHPSMRVVSLYDIMHSDYAHKRKDGGIEYYYSIPNNKKVEFKAQDVFIDPYTLGLLIGDGCLTKSCPNVAELTSEEEDFEFYKQHVPYEMYARKGKYSHGIKINNIQGYLEEYNLWNTTSSEKFIPKEYLFNTSDVRIAVLQGIMDTDGTVNNNGIPMLTTTSKRLARDIRWLCNSLGYNSRMFTKQGKYKDDKGEHVCKLTYNISILTNDHIFRLPRKLEKLTDFKSAYSRSKRDWTRIVNIKYSHREKAKCVIVDNESHCYLIGDFIVTHNTSMGAAILSKRFVLGESAENRKEVQCMVTAADRTKLIGTNQILDVFIDYIDFCAKNTQFASHRLKSSIQELTWEMGYKKSGSDVAYGSKNSVSGIISGVNQDKLNGSRGVMYLVEEAGIFKDLREMYNMIRPSVEQGSSVFGQVLLYGTAGNDQSDFTAFAEMFYSPDGYNLNGLPNVFDKEGQGRKECCMFYPAYLNYDDSCIDENGNSNVTKALLKLCNDRFKVKYGSSDINTITRRISQYPITPQEAIIRSQGNVFPVTELNERLNQIDNNPSEYDDVYVGDLIFNKENKVEFVPNADLPIRDYPTKDNKVKGALEIYQMPEKDSKGEVFAERYIASLDPIDFDVASSTSLGSMFVLDLWTDKLVAEYTGRPPYANDLYEIVRKTCLFYNAKCMYEAHPYSQEVLTPEGKKLWGDINIGDKLFAPNGKIVSVVDIPVNEYMPIYKVTLVDGREIMCSDNHIWNVYRNNRSKQGTVNLTTSQMMTAGVKNKHGQHNFFIPNGGIVEYLYKDVPIDPYTLGLLIAEGAFTKFKKGKYENYKRRAVQISSSKEDMEFYKTVIPYEIKYIGTKGSSWHLYIDDIDIILNDLGLLYKDSSNNSIPDLYMYNDCHTRMELLKGLMDGDGCAVKQGASVYITTSPELRDNVMSLCRSLGINCKYTTIAPAVLINKDTGEHYNTKEHYRINIYTETCIFKIPRKVEKQHKYCAGKRGSKADGILNKTAIKSIEFSHYEQGKCVTVSSEDGLYMVGDYVVTHNCNIKGTFSYFSTYNCTHLLADTPSYLKDKQLITTIGYGNQAKGIRAIPAVINYSFRLIRDWLLKPVTKVEKDADGNEKEVKLPNLYNIRNRALLKELILWNPNGNYDRIMSLAQLLLYREEKMVLYQGNISNREPISSGIEMDDYWSKNYKGKKERPTGVNIYTDDTIIYAGNELPSSW